ncbi:MAG: aldehyde dehydrogenase family protein [Chloroflexota bacterium]|nr:aldehyde dehydrogenase family protein [Chloroflexota bacterium]
MISTDRDQQTAVTKNERLPEFKFIVGGQWREGTPYTVYCPYDAAPVATVHRAGAGDLEEATRAAVRALKVTRKLPSHRRAAILRKIADAVTARSEDLARSLALEAGKPIKLARLEVSRAAMTFGVSAEEATRINDEVIHMDALPGGENRQGIIRRFPVGPVAAITPFNFPLNLVAHKIAPAIAAGCPIVLKPASQTPISALKLGEIVLEAGWPEEALSILHLQSSDSAPLVEDERFKLLTFTGSPTVGWDLKSRAGSKKVTLELGGNAGVIIHSDADLDYAVERCIFGGFSYAGQSCISVQRIFVHEPVYQQFLDKLVPRVNALKVGHPLDEDTDVASVITTKDSERVKEWLDEALSSGAECLAGGEVKDGVVRPTVVVKAGPDLRVNNREIFAPVVTVQPYDDFDQAVEAVNNSSYGLQAGVFTRDIKRIFSAFEELEVGGVNVNDVSTYRMDHMPYGGIKQSGFGKEGPKYAIEEMTDPKLLVINLA